MSTQLPTLNGKETELMGSCLGWWYVWMLHC